MSGTDEARAARGEDRVEELRVIGRLIDEHRRRLARRAIRRGAANAVALGALATIALLVAARAGGLPARAALLAFAAVPLAATVGAVRARGRVALDQYRAAKQVDDLLGARDRIATAWFLLNDEAAGASPLSALAIADGVGAAREARLPQPARERLSALARAGAALLLAAVGVSFALFHQHRAPADRALSQESSEEMARLLHGLGDLKGGTPEQRQRLASVLADVGMSADDLQKLDQAEVIERLKKQGIEYRKAGSEDKAKLLEAAAQQIAQAEAIRQEAAQIEATNQKIFQLTLSDGRSVAGVRIKTKATDERIVASRLASAAGVKEPVSAEEEALEQESRAADERANATRAAHGFGQLDKAGAGDTAALAVDDETRKRREAATRDPESPEGRKYRDAVLAHDLAEVAKAGYSGSRGEMMAKWSQSR